MSRLADNRLMANIEVIQTDSTAFLAGQRHELPGALVASTPGAAEGVIKDSDLTDLTGDRASSWAAWE